MRGCKRTSEDRSRALFAALQPAQVVRRHDEPYGRMCLRVNEPFLQVSLSPPLMTMRHRRRADDCLKASSYMTDALLDPATAASSSPALAAAPRAFATDKPYFAFVNDGKHDVQLARFSTAMVGFVGPDPLRGRCIDVERFGLSHRF